MNCPKCNAQNSLHRNEDGDLECLCGYIEYENKAQTITDKPKIPLIKRSESLKIIEDLRRKAILELRKELENTDDPAISICESYYPEALRKILNTWIEALPMDSDPVRHGLASGLIEFDTYLAELDKKAQEIFEE